VRIELEYRHGESGRPEGTLRVGGEPEARHFVGMMQLLRLLEELSDTEPSADTRPQSRVDCLGGSH
jgi:hypothetical protein